MGANGLDFYLMILSLAIAFSIPVIEQWSHQI
jgi:hypothetical protein